LSFAQTAFGLIDQALIVAADRIVAVQLEPYELFFVPMNGGMIEYIYRNWPETISREVDLKSGFADCLFLVWWALVTFNHPKELMAKRLRCEKGLAL
jgi:hypothetical protein